MLLIQYTIYVEVNLNSLPHKLIGHLSFPVNSGVDQIYVEKAELIAL